MIDAPSGSPTSGGNPRKNFLIRGLQSDHFWSTVWRVFSLALIVVALVFLGRLFFGAGAGSFELKNGEYMRGLITILLLIATLVLEAVLILTTLFAAEDNTKDRVDQGKEILAPLFGILGTIVGFYFGSATQQQATTTAAAAAATVVAERTVGGRGPAESPPIAPRPGAGPATAPTVPQ